MAFTYGFYNSLNHDRKYDSVQISQIFDGMILDGVYSTVGNCFVVRASSTASTVIVGSGRAWFDHTWNYNDSDMVLTAPQSDILMNRIDAIVLDIYSAEQSRTNNIIWVQGTPSSNPVKPTLIKQLGHTQYPLAYVLRKPNVETISQADITNAVGTSECPFVTGLLEHVSIDQLLAQWSAQWTDYYNAKVADMNATSALWKQQWEQFYNLYTADMTATGQAWKNQWETWFNAYTESSSEALNAWMEAEKATILQWFEDLQDLLNGDVAVNLANEILALKQRADILEHFDEILSTEFAVYHNIDDNNGNGIADSSGNAIEGKILFEIK